MKINLKDLNIILLDKKDINKYSSYSKFFKNIYAVNRDYKVSQLYDAFKSNNTNIDLILYQVDNEETIDFDAFINPIRAINEHIPILLNFSNDKFLPVLKNHHHNITICYNPSQNNEILFRKIIICVKNHIKIKTLHNKFLENEKYLEKFNNVTLVSITDANGIIKYVNDKFCEETGYTKDELIGKTHNIHKHPDIRSEFYKDMWKTIKNGMVWQGNYKNLHKNGYPYWVKSTIFPIFNENKELIEFMCIRFLTTEEELQKKDSRKKTLNTLIGNKKLIHQLKSKIRELENYENNVYIRTLQEQISELRKELNASKNKESNSVNDTISKFRNIQDQLHFALNKIKQKEQVISNLKSDIKKRDETITNQLSKINKLTVEARNLTIDLNNAESSLLKLKREKEKKKARFFIA